MKVPFGIKTTGATSIAFTFVLYLLLTHSCLAAPFRILSEEVEIPTPPNMARLPEAAPFIVAFEKILEEKAAQLPAKERPSQRTTNVTVVFERRETPDKTLRILVMPYPLPDVYADRHLDEREFEKAGLSNFIPDEKSARHRFYWRNPELQGFQAYVLCRGKILLLRLSATTGDGTLHPPSPSDLQEFKKWIADFEAANPASGTGLLDRTTVTIATLLASLLTLFYWINREKLKAKGVTHVPVPPGVA